MLTNEIIQLWSVLATIGFCTALVVRLGYAIFRQFKRVNYVKKFSEYRAVLEYNMEKAYDMIHKEHILVFSLDAYRLEDKDYDIASTEFVRLVEKFVGPMLLSEFIELYGNEDTFIFNLLEFFSGRYESDEIRNASLEQITEAEVDEQLPNTQTPEI